VQGTVAHHYYSHVVCRDWWDGYDVAISTPGSARPSMAVQTSVARTCWARASGTRGTMDRHGLTCIGTYWRELARLKLQHAGWEGKVLNQVPPHFLPPSSHHFSSLSTLSSQPDPWATTAP
jgi:hypothetical protein